MINYFNNDVLYISKYFKKIIVSYPKVALHMSKFNYAQTGSFYTIEIIKNFGSNNYAKRILYKKVIYQNKSVYYYIFKNYMYSLIINYRFNYLIYIKQRKLLRPLKYKYFVQNKLFNYYNFSYYNKFVYLF